MSAERLSRWHPVLRPPSLADHETHLQYFAMNKEALPSAVLVFHGIGEEVRFETLGRAASLILVEAEEREASGISVVIRSVPSDKGAGNLVVRAELSWKEKDGTPRQVHVYEAYWAPLTAGKITFGETIGFLLSAGWNGLTGTLRSGKLGSFRRWLFGAFQDLKITLATGWLLAVLMVLVGVIAFAIAMAAAAAAGVVKKLGDGGKAGIANAAEYVYNEVAAVWNAAVHIPFWILAHLHLANGQPQWVNFILFDPVLSRRHPWQAVAAVVLWGILIGTALWFRGILTAYVGSLVAYLSPYKDSKFDELRDKIQQVGQDAVQLIYDGYKLPSGWIPKYDRIVILGHSLGSVIAYDTLNWLFNTEAARNLLGVPNTAVERTKALVTFGSPLDKTAFLFRVQLKRSSSRLDQEGELRETMVSAVQPLIASYDFRFDPNAPSRRPKWINLWSRMDIISGNLDYYDKPDVASSDPRHVQNQIDPGARIPLLAHNQYWTKKLLRTTVYQELF
jgi:hypothetical protein